MAEVEIRAESDHEAWAAACADRLAGTLRDVLEQNDRAVFAGAGGSTPEPIYARLALADLDWSRVTVTLVDERHVPETSPESNAALMKRSLLNGRAGAARFVPLFSPQITVDRAGAVATRALADEGRRLDAVLLGMGEDGHICSMFPDSPALKTLLYPNLSPTVFGVPAGRGGLGPTQERLSMNLPFLMTARRVVLAITGRQKRAVFEREAAGDPGSQPIAALLAAKVPLEVIWTEASR